MLAADWCQRQIQIEATDWRQLIPSLCPECRGTSRTPGHSACRSQRVYRPEYLIGKATDEVRRSQLVNFEDDLDFIASRDDRRSRRVRQRQERLVAGKGVGHDAAHAARRKQPRSRLNHVGSDAAASQTALNTQAKLRLPPVNGKLRNSSDRAGAMKRTAPERSIEGSEHEATPVPQPIDMTVQTVFRQ